MKLLLASLFLSVVAISHAQDWVPYLSEGPLNIELSEYNRIDEKYGKDHQLIIFRFTNTSENAIAVSFKRNTEYVDRSTSASDNIFEVIIEANQSLEYSQDPRNKAFYIFKKDNKGFIKGSLAQFEITNLTIQ